MNQSLLKEMMYSRPKNKMTILINGKPETLDVKTTLVDLIRKYKVKKAKITGGTIAFES